MMNKKPTPQELREAAERFQTGSYSDSPYDKDEWYGPVQLHDDMKMLVTHYAEKLLTRKPKPHKEK